MWPFVPPKARQLGISIGHRRELKPQAALEWFGSPVETCRKLGKAVVVAFEHRLIVGMADWLVVREDALISQNGLT